MFGSMWMEERTDEGEENIITELTTSSSAGMHANLQNAN